MKNIINWIVFSSSNSEKISLTVKGALGIVVTVLTTVLGLASIHVGDLTPIVDSVIAVVQAFFALISAIVFLVGLIRKIVRTIQGNNEVLIGE